MTDYKKIEVAKELPAGTQAIGKLAANSGVDIGDVDVKSIAAGDNNIGNVDIVTMPSVTVGTLPSTPAGDNNIGNVDVVTLPALVAGAALIGEVKPTDDSGNHQVAFDTVARAGFVKVTDGTDMVLVDAVGNFNVSVWNGANQMPAQDTV